MQKDMKLYERQVHHDTGIVTLAFKNDNGDFVEHRRYESEDAERDAAGTYEVLKGAEWVPVSPTPKVAPVETVTEVAPAEATEEVVSDDEPKATKEKK